MDETTGGTAGGTSTLFEPYELKHLVLRNRIISTPHGPAYAERALPQERYQAYHEEKAKGGLAMTMFGGSSNVSPDSPSLFGQLYLGHDEIIPHFQRLSERVHAHGAALMCQITHMGHRVPWDQGHWLPPISASAVRDRAHRAYPKAMEEWDIARVIEDYGQAARRCREGGLDGCELALTGHLANQFLMPGMNRRDDGYGGALENRLRFTLEALAEIRRRVGADYIVGLRYPVDERCAGGLDAEACIAAARLLAESGMVDFFNVYLGTPSYNPIFPDHLPNMAAPFAPYLEAVGRFKQAVGKPVFHATRMHDVAAAARGLREGALDLVGMTRAHMADPYFVAKLQRGEEARIRPCVGASYCIDRIYTGGDALCLHNPATGRERELPQQIARGAGKPRRVVVVGGGPAGLEAARVSAERGHDVVLFEASKELGGQVAIAARASWRRDLLGIVRWLADEVERLGVEVRTNLYAEAEDVLAEAPDVVIVATGGLPDTELGAGAEHVISVWDALNAPAQLGDAVLVYDVRGDHQALSCAQALAEAGRRVELVTPDRMAGEEIGLSNSVVYLRAFERLGITTTADTGLVSVAREGGRLAVRLRPEYGGAEETRAVDSVVVELGTQPLDALYFALKDGSSNQGALDLDALLAGRPQALRGNPAGSYQLFRLGDAVASRNIHAALYDALRICKDL